MTNPNLFDNPEDNFPTTPLPDVPAEAHNSIPPVDNFPTEPPPPSETLESRTADRAQRIESMFQKVMPKIRERKVGIDPKQPWLSSPLVEKTVRATLEELYDLNVE